MKLMAKVGQLRPELRSRIRTGVIGGALLLAVTLGLGTVGTAIVAVGIALFMTHEYLGMVLSLDDKVIKRQVFLGIVWLVGFFSVFFPRVEYGLLLAAFLGTFFYFLATASRHAESPESKRKIGRASCRERVYACV